MSPSSPQHEPTMEEILASIRKIISEDSSEPQPASPPAQANPVQSVQEADVLELTQEIHEEPPGVAPPAPVIVAAPPPQLEPIADDVEFQPIEETPVSSPAKASSQSGDGIFSEKTRKVLSDSFVRTEPEPPVVPAGPAASVAPMDGRTIEAAFDHAVRTTFDPVLQSWLDQNKDTVVERMKPVITQWLEDRVAPMLEKWVRDEVAAAAKEGVRR
jgi:uncharacterized protein